MNILITGAAGFIGAALAVRLVAAGHSVIGLDNLNSYYSPYLKLGRLKMLGVDASSVPYGGAIVSPLYGNYTFYRADLTDFDLLQRIFQKGKPDIVVNLAAQAGVRYSLQNPRAYIRSNVEGFLNVLECCRRQPVKHLVYASSSSVYGGNSEVPYREDMNTDTPASLYAATKKADELMAHTYSSLYSIPATGLRFFTVYGPWGRPDMAPYIFMKAVIAGEHIRVFNHGRMSRDFTYIDDIIDAVERIIAQPPTADVPHEVYNIGRSQPVELLEFIREIERVSGRKAQMEMEEMQPGDVTDTYADTTRLRDRFGITPKISLSEGLSRFYNWFLEYGHLGSEA